MSKPVLITDPATGRQCYTKHPEKLIQRRRARWEAEELKAAAETEERVVHWWNGSDRNPFALHQPGVVRS